MLWIRLIAPRQAAKKYCCELHNFEWLKKNIELLWKGNTFKQTYKMLILEQIGEKLSFTDTTTALKGVAWDRALAWLLTTNVNNHIINHDETITVKDCNEMISDLQTHKPRTLKEQLHISEEMNIARAAQFERLNSDLAQTATVVQQMAEAICIEEHGPPKLIITSVFWIAYMEG
jgi:hypothetical protein